MWGTTAAAAAHAPATAPPTTSFFAAPRPPTTPCGRTTHAARCSHASALLALGHHTPAPGRGPLLFGLGLHALLSSADADSDSYADADALFFSLPVGGPVSAAELATLPHALVIRRAGDAPLDLRVSVEADGYT